MTPAPSPTFLNPVRADGADPHITYLNGQYHLIVTSGDGIDIIRAATLADLADAPALPIWRDGTPERGFNLWAPEAHFLTGPNGGRWYLYYTAGPANAGPGQQRLHVLESAGEDLLGPYRHRARLFDPDADFWAIDGTVLHRADGRFYLVYSGHPDATDTTQNLYIAPLRDPWTLAGPRALLSAPEHPWERLGGPPAVNEGPTVFQRDGQIFLVYSASGCWSPDYALGMLVADEGADLLDRRAWAKVPGPVFSRNDAAGVYGPGHASFFRSPDGTEDWIVYHAREAPTVGVPADTGPGRSTRAQRISWGADGLPVLGVPVPLGVRLAAPSGETVRPGAEGTGGPSSPG